MTNPNQPGPPPVIDAAAVATEQDARDLFLGMLDVLFGFGIALANKGLVTRAELAAAMVEIGRQQESQHATAPRRLPAQFVGGLFATPVITTPPGKMN